jgi:large subunit ribosomal protein L30
LPRLRRSDEAPASLGDAGKDKDVGRISVTWKKSTIGFPQDQRGTIESLGLKRLHHTVEHDDTRTILGMVHKVRHLVKVVDVTPDTGTESDESA